MSKEVLLIFQDCPYCKPREEWGKRQMQLAKDHNIVVRETKYNFPGAKGLIQKALNHGLSTMPFYTDGKMFSYDLSSFIPTPVPAPEPDEKMDADKAEKATTAEKVAAVTKRVSRKKTTEEVETDGVDKQD